LSFVRITITLVTIILMCFSPVIGLNRVDHVVGNQPDLEMGNVADW